MGVKIINRQRVVIGNRKGDYLREMETPMVLGYELERESLTPKRSYIKSISGQDYGADPIGGGMFRMVPSGDIVDYAERQRRLAQQHNPEGLPSVTEIQRRYIERLKPIGRAHYRQRAFMRAAAQREAEKQLKAWGYSVNQIDDILQEARDVAHLEMGAGMNPSHPIIGDYDTEQELIEAAADFSIGNEQDSGIRDHFAAIEAALSNAWYYAEHYGVSEHALVKEFERRLR